MLKLLGQLLKQLRQLRKLFETTAEVATAAAEAVGSPSTAAAAPCTIVEAGSAAETPAEAASANAEAASTPASGASEAASAPADAASTRAVWPEFDRDQPDSSPFLLSGSQGRGQGGGAQPVTEGGHSQQLRSERDILPCARDDLRLRRSLRTTTPRARGAAAQMQSKCKDPTKQEAETWTNQTQQNKSELQIMRVQRHDQKNVPEHHLLKPCAEEGKRALAAAMPHAMYHPQNNIEANRVLDGHIRPGLCRMRVTRRTATCLGGKAPVRGACTVSEIRPRLDAQATLRSGAWLRAKMGAAGMVRRGEPRHGTSGPLSALKISDFRKVPQIRRSPKPNTFCSPRRAIAAAGRRPSPHQTMRRR